MSVSEHDIAFMRAALAYARRGLGQTAPNPSVAALVVDENTAWPVPLARGRTAAGGRPHAEAIALRAAGDRARGATLYVTLEPCARRSVRYDGPSCAENILEAGIRRVVIGAPDPSPFAAGEGATRLRKAGVEVVEGVCAEEACALVAGHRLRVSENRPFIRIKLAQSADGYAGTADRKPIALTGEDARALVHRLRADADVIITGIGTVLADDPRLDVRLPGMEALSPIRVVLDTNGRMPLAATMLSDASRVPVWIATAAPDALAELTSAHPGVEIIAVPSGADGHLDLAALAGALAARGMTRAMIEAGPTLAEAFAKAGLCDELVLFTAPKTVGRGLPAMGEALARWADHAHIEQDRRVGPDRLQVWTRKTELG